jgi:hypothetical protein
LKCDFKHFIVEHSTSPDAGSEENYSSSSDIDSRDAENINSVALPDDPATDLESDEDSITQECYRIFQEYDPQQSQCTVSKVRMKCYNQL